MIERLKVIRQQTSKFTLKDLNNWWISLDKQNNQMRLFKFTLCFMGVLIFGYALKETLLSIGNADYKVFADEGGKWVWYLGMLFEGFYLSAFGWLFAESWVGIESIYDNLPVKEKRVTNCVTALLLILASIAVMIWFEFSFFTGSLSSEIFISRVLNYALAIAIPIFMVLISVLLFVSFKRSGLKFVDFVKLPFKEKVK